MSELPTPSYASPVATYFGAAADGPSSSFSSSLAATPTIVSIAEYFLYGFCVELNINKLLADGRC
eukprot:COSAG02_NODE_67972_length_251_cov_1.407895_1_plen_64_part_10